MSTISGKGTRVFVFYDTETTGLDKDFIQILQMGMLFTDDDLNILSSKKIDCRNSPWDLPSAGAMLTTGFTPANLKSSKNSNFDMMQQINDWLRGQHWPVTFIGYNSMEYDEPVLAQNFYQNLLPAGLTTARNHINGQVNGRADVMNMVDAVAVYMPGALKLDILTEAGKPSRTLKNVAKQNGVVLSDQDAHDALNDIKATVGVAKVIMKAAPQIWNMALKLSTIEGVDKFLGEYDTFTYTRSRFGNTRSSVATSVVETKGGAKQVLFDLRVDPAPYLDLSPEQLKKVLLTKGNPFTTIRKDAQPTLMPMELSDAVLTEQDKTTVFTQRAKAIKSHAAFLENVAKAEELAYREQMADLPALSSKMPETQINRRLSPTVQAKLDDWSKQYREAATWHDRAVLTKGFDAYFKEELAADPAFVRFEKLAARLIFEHAPQELSEARQEAMKKFIANRILDPDPKAPYMTIDRARKDLQHISEERAAGKERWKEVTDSEITKLKLYYTSLEKAYLPHADESVKQARLQPPAVNNNTPQVPAAPADKKVNDNTPKV